MTRKLLSLAVASAIVGAARSRARAGVRAERRNRGAQGAARRAVGEDRPAREVADADQEDRRRNPGHRRQDRRRRRAGARRALSFAGDLRYRNESFDVQYVDRDRNRDRIRARFNANFRVNDTITGVLGIATGGPDPRSGNQTLTDQNSRKDFELDLALRAPGRRTPTGSSPRASSVIPGSAPAACSTTATSIPKASRSTTPRAISSPARSTTGWPSARCRSAT